MCRCPRLVQKPLQTQGFGRRDRARRAAPGGARRRRERRRGSRAAARGAPPGRAALGGVAPTGRSSGGPGSKGWVAYPVKKLLRPFLRWYVEPLAHEQRMFNDVVLKLVDGLLEEVDRGERSREEAARTLGELEERLTRAERRGARRARPRRSPRSRPRRPSPTTSPSRRRCAARPPTSASASAPYVDDFRDAAPVLDVGCGRGEFLGAAPRRRHRGARASTPTPTWSPTRAARASRSSRPTRSPTSRRSPDGSLGGIFAAQVVEHLPPAALFRLLELAAREAPPRRPARRRDDQPALAARPPLLLRRPDARAAARPRDARAARAAGRLPRGRDPLPQRAAPRRRRRRADPRDPLRAARLRDRRQNLRIAVCRPQVPFARGGVEIFTDDLVAELRTRGHEADLVTVPFKWYPGRARADAGVPLAAARPRRGGRPADRPRDRDEVPLATSSATRTRSSGSSTSSARRTSSTAPSSGSSASRPRSARSAAQVQELDKVALGEARKVFATSRNVADRLERSTGIAAEVMPHPPQELAVPLRRVRRLRPLGRPARPREADRPADRGGASAAASQVVVAGDGPDRERLESLANGARPLRRPRLGGGARRPVRALPRRLLRAGRRGLRDGARTRRSSPRSRS